MPVEDFPLFLERGEGAYVFAPGGERYLDFMLGKGPVVLGYGYAAVQRAVQEQIARGNLLSMAVPRQITVAELLLDHFPCADLVRFHKSGSEACASAVRIARAFTGRRWILSSGYHGWHDWNNPDAAGSACPSGFADFHYDLEVLARLLEFYRGEVAAIFVEPIPEFLAADFYRTLRAAADSADCLLLFDEVKTGFRVPSNSTQATVQVVPDVTTLSKAIANGYCLSCVIGRADIIELADTLHVAGTFDIEATPFAAAEATLRALAAENAIPRMAAATERLTVELNHLLDSDAVPARAFPMGTMFRIGFLEPARETFFYIAMARHGVLLYPYDNHFFSLAHGERQQTEFLEAAERAIAASVREMAPQAGLPKARDLQLHQFIHRKGFLAGCPGPHGRMHAAAATGGTCA